MPLILSSPAGGVGVGLGEGAGVGVGEGVGVGVGEGVGVGVGEGVGIGLGDGVGSVEFSTLALFDMSITLVTCESHDLTAKNVTRHATKKFIKVLPVRHLLAQDAEQRPCR